MSSRNRGRGTSNQDADEERRLWGVIKEKGKDVDAKVARSNEIGSEIIQVEAQQAALLDANQPASASLDERLEKLYRENVKITEEVQQIIEGGSNDMNLLDSIKILAGLREASEESLAAMASSQTTQRAAAANGSGRNKPKKASGKSAIAVATTASSALAEEADEAISAAPSPRITISAAANRLAKEKSSRAPSLPTTREPSVKIEDGAESVASSTDAPSTTAAGKAASSSSAAANRSTNRLVLQKGEIVFCRHDPKNYDAKKGEAPEGEGILCRVTSVIGEGKQRRYEVQDADVDVPAAGAAGGDPLMLLPPPPQRASVAQLMQIPRTNKGLCDLPKGRSVLAQYPDTTTFYKAEVSEAWRNGVEVVRLVRLNFQDDEAVREVERRFVLSDK
ncbi:hypothetical protein LTR36_010502 [Oleoguttula mirabilis]|uniref:SGF29 C-terminal domain-containing protein n=1 Tax=Oleoguttula mirabilis TaxID=1507867 RepID=A0AAV9J4U5_9PEZI|nr:hypothetical protein LTR36_010502 [Oleoguttula mirabilis]